MYKERESLQQTISMSKSFFSKNQMTTIVLMLEPTLPTNNICLMEMLAKAYFCLGFFKSCRQVSLVACTTIKSSPQSSEQSFELCSFLYLIILSEIEMGLAVAKQHEDQLRKHMKDSKELADVISQIAKMRQKNNNKQKVDMAQVKAKFQMLQDKARNDKYLSIAGVPAFIVSNSWLKKFDEGIFEPINSLDLIQRSEYLDLDKNYLHMNYILRPDKQQGNDYTIIAYEPWQYLLDVFGGTEIKRIVEKAGESTRVQVTYQNIKVLIVTPARIKLIEIPISKNEVCLNLKTHIKRISVWHKLIEPDAASKQFKLLKIKDMHDPALLAKQIAARKLTNYTEVIELNDIADFEEMELGLRQFLVFQIFANPGTSVFGKLKKQAIQSSDRCFTCFSKNVSLTECVCKTVSFCSTKCKTTNIKHEEQCRKILKETNPIQSLITKYRINTTIRVPENFKSSGKTGLQNIGNTCFMNSALQCLANIEDLTKYFLRNEHLSHINMNNKLGSQGNLASAYGQFLKELFFTEKRAIEPRVLKKIIQRCNNQFTGYHQQDSQQFLSYFLDLLHEDLNQVKQKPIVEALESDGRPDQVISAISLENYHKRNRSIIAQLMVGLYKSQLNCPKCNRVSITFDPYMTVTLPMPNDKEPKIKLQAYVITLNGTISKVQLKIPHNRLLSFVYETLGRQFCCAFVQNKKIKQTIEGDQSAKLISSSTSLLFMYEVEDKSNVQIRLTILDQTGTELTFCRRVKTKNINTAEQLKEIIYMRLQKPFSIFFKIENESDSSYLKFCYEKQVIDFRDVQKLAYPLKVNSVTDVSIYLNDPYKSIKMSNVGTYPLLPAQKLTISSLLKLFSVPEQLTEDNSWYCNKCKDHVLAKKKLCLYSTPKYLILHLKRFSHKIAGRYVYNNKIDSTVKLSQFEEINGCRYELISMVNHMGSLSGGHYTATVKKNDWVCFDDERVRGDRLSGDYVYLLFYRRVDSA